MIGDVVTDDGEVYEVVWSGGEGLIPDRETKPSGFWTPPKRLYTPPESFKPRKAFSAGDVSRMVELSESGMTFAEIGRVFDVFGTTVSRIVRRNRVDKPNGTEDSDVE